MLYCGLQPCCQVTRCCILLSLLPFQVTSSNKYISSNLVSVTFVYIMEMPIDWSLLSRFVVYQDNLSILSILCCVYIYILRLLKERCSYYHTITLISWVPSHIRSI